MALEGTRQLLGALIQQQQKEKARQRNPEYQAGMYNLYNSILEKEKRNQVLENISTMSDPGEILKEIARIDPAPYLKYRIDEEKRLRIDDLINQFTADDTISPTELVSLSAAGAKVPDKIPLSLDQQKELRATPTTHRTMVTGGGPGTGDDIFKKLIGEWFDISDKIVDAQGRPLAADKTAEVQAHFLTNRGVLPKGYQVKPRVTDRGTLEKVVKSDILGNWKNISKDYRAGNIFTGDPNAEQVSETMFNLLQLDDSQIDALPKVKKEFRDNLKKLKGLAMQQSAQPTTEEIIKPMNIVELEKEYNVEYYYDEQARGWRVKQ